MRPTVKFPAKARLFLTEQQSTMEAERRQQLHSPASALRQNFMPSTLEQQKHFTSEVSWWNFSTSTRSTSRSTQAHQVARAWPQELDRHGRPSTLSSNTFSSNNWSRTTLWDASISTQTIAQQTYWPSMSQQRLCNDTYNKLDLASGNSTFTEATGKSFTSSVQQQASCSVQRAQYIHLRRRIWAMGSTKVDHTFFAVTTSWSI